MKRKPSKKMKKKSDKKKVVEDGVMGIREATEKVLESLDEDFAKGPKTITMNELKSAFQVFDSDNSGFIDKAELILVLKSVGRSLSDEDLDEIIDSIDVNGDGLISFEEFVYVVQVKMYEFYEDDEDISLLFDFFDLNRDGRLTIDELRKTCHEKLGLMFSDNELQDMIRFGDELGDNTISKDEFQRMMNTAHREAFS